jgi:septation ring formation regulator EzrA
MSEKPVVLRLADDFDRDAKRELFRYLDLDKAATELRRQHAEIERLREALEKIADASMSMHLNAAHMATSLQGIAKAALRREDV